MMPHIDHRGSIIVYYPRDVLTFPGRKCGHNCERRGHGSSISQEDEVENVKERGKPLSNKRRINGIYGWVEQGHIK